MKKPPDDLEAGELELGGERYMVLSFPVPAPDLRRLTATEIAIARAVVDGKSNAEIAAARGRSARTIANQVATIFRKLGVGSRLELALRLRG